ncbi:MAG: heavy metal translocating P-type ATPase, partial [Planctomycetes bacterium]|nr:heavy metal translocating P-type ATPase [Planctomycetota bacterium]
MPKQQAFRIDGMDCAEEATILKRDVGPLVGGAEQLSFDVLNGRMSVPESVAAKVGVDAIIAAVAKTGMKATPITEGKPAAGDDVDRHRRRVMRLAASSGVMTLFGFVAQGLAAENMADVFRETDRAIDVVPLVSKLLYGVAILAGVWTFLPKAWAALRRIRPDMN